MLLRKSARFALAVLAMAGARAVVACGPAAGTSDWMLGTFSDTKIKQEAYGLGHDEFHEDGRLVLINVTRCGENVREQVLEYEWRRDGDSHVIVELNGPEGGVDQWLISAGETCETLKVEEVVDGEAFFGFTLWRGAVCMELLPPCTPEQVERPGCKTVWCDGPPPECEE